jgi:hypothetical protein
MLLIKDWCVLVMRHRQQMLDVDARFVCTPVMQVIAVRNRPRQLRVEQAMHQPDSPLEQHGSVSTMAQSTSPQQALTSRARALLNLGERESPTPLGHARSISLVTVSWAPSGPY